MKLYFVICVSLSILCIGLTQANDELKERMKKLRDECQREVNAPLDLVTRLDRGEYAGDGTDLRCYPKCFFQKAGFMNSNGQLNIAAMKEMVKNAPAKDKMVEVIDHCMEHHAREGKDACDTAFIGYKCFKDRMKELNINH